MPTRLRHILLPFTVFLTGACILIVEVVATRILSPYFGNTIFAVSSVISVVLGALSIGYYFGGKLADKHPTLNWFFSIILVSSLVLLTLHSLGQIILPKLSTSLPITTGPLIVSLLLFFVPCLLLGTLSPFAIKLQQILTPQQGIGSISGTMFFWSTLGSIVGSLSSGFYLIPHFGINQIMLGVSAMLFLIGVTPLIIKKTMILSISFFILFFGITVFSLSTFSLHTFRLVYQTDGIYERIRIFDVEKDGRPTRVLLQDSTNSGAMYLDTQDASDLVYGYTKYYALYQEQSSPINQALVIGAGMYVVPKALLQELPNVHIDVVDIEPSLYELATEYFDLKPNDRLTNIIQDGRRFLFESDQHYDLIFADAYGSLYSVPTHLMTQEFMQLAHNRLTDNGIFIGNFIGDTYQEDPSIILSAMSTFESVFDRTYYFGVDSATSPEAQNIMFLGIKNGEAIDFQNPLFKDHLIDRSTLDLSSHPILTDNFAPVEYLSSQTLKRM